MKKNVNLGDEINELPGQLFKDLVKLNNEEFCCTRWSFDSRAMEYAFQGVKGAEGIGNRIVDLAKKNEKALRKEMGLEGNKGREAWLEFVDELKQDTSKIIEVKAI
ncbi:hypothetical protein [Shewanella japonica]|nr:hypothetical protein [Shewanella japonica]